MESALPADAATREQTEEENAGGIEMMQSRRQEQDDTDPSEFFLINQNQERQKNKDNENDDNDIIALDMPHSSEQKDEQLTWPMQTSAQKLLPQANSFNLKTYPTQPQYSNYMHFNPHACSTPIQSAQRRVPLGEVNPNIRNKECLPSPLHPPASAHHLTPQFGIYEVQSPAICSSGSSQLPIRSITPAPFRRQFLHPYGRQISTLESTNRNIQSTDNSYSLSSGQSSSFSPSSINPTSSYMAAHPALSHSLSHSNSHTSSSAQSEEAMVDSSHSAADFPASYAPSPPSPLVAQPRFVFEDKNGLKIAGHFGQRGLGEEFEQVTGRLCLMSTARKYKVTIGEILRRVREPETMHLSLVSGLLRKGKCSNSSKDLQKQLQAVGLYVPSGRRKSFGITSFTALCEEEALHMADDFRKLIVEMNTTAMARCLVGIGNDVQSMQPKPEEYTRFVNQQLVGARWFIDVMASVYSGVSTNPAEMSQARNPAEHVISTLSLMSHGFAHNAIKSVLLHLRSMVDEMTKALSQVPVIGQRSTTAGLVQYPVMPTHLVHAQPPYFHPQPSPSLSTARHAPECLSVPSTPVPSSPSPYLIPAAASPSTHNPAHTMPYSPHTLQVHRPSSSSSSTNFHSPVHPH